MLATIQRELDKLATRIGPDVLAVTDPAGMVLAVSGLRRKDWPVQAAVPAQPTDADTTYVTTPSGVFRFASAPLTLQDAHIGSLQLARALDRRYAEELATLSGAATLIASGGAVVASTLPGDEVTGLTPAVMRQPCGRGGRCSSARSEYAVKPLFKGGDTTVYALDSITASTRAPLQNALTAVSLMAIGSFALAAIRQRLAGAHDRPANRHAVDLALGDDRLA